MKNEEKKTLLWKKVKLLKVSDFTFFHNVFYAICNLKSFNSHISVVFCSFFEFATISKLCIWEWVNRLKKISLASTLYEYFKECMKIHNALELCLCEVMVVMQNVRTKLDCVESLVFALHRSLSYSSLIWWSRLSCLLIGFQSNNQEIIKT